MGSLALRAQYHFLVCPLQRAASVRSDQPASLEFEQAV